MSGPKSDGKKWQTRVKVKGKWQTRVKIHAERTDNKIAAQIITDA